MKHRPPSRTHSRILPVLWGLLTTVSVLHPADAPPLILPPLIVEGKVIAAPWQYVRGDWYEMLSRCPDSVTREFLQRQERLHALLGAIVPGEFQARLARPIAFILSPKSSTPTLTWNAIAKRFDEPAAAPVGGIGGSRLVQFMPNLLLADSDSLAVFAIVDVKRFEAGALGLAPASVGFLIERRTPTLPPWPVTGVATLCTQVVFKDQAVEFEPFTWRSAEATERLRRNSNEPRILLAVGDLLTGRAPEQELDRARIQELWQSECALFVRWALDPEVGDARAFWEFVRRCAAEPEADRQMLFEASFGRNYSDLRDLLSDYLPRAVTRGFELKGPKARKPPRLSLRPATTDEVARIMGDWERREAVWLEASRPEVAPRYREAARRSFARVEKADERSPELLAAMGLCELEAHNLASARELLEAAAKGRVVRPRVYLEIARLRYEAACAQGKSLSVVQANFILEPLATARSMQPPLSDSYLLAAKVWTKGQTRLGENQLGLLEEGVRLFANDPELLLATATALAAQGRPERAGQLIDRGLELAPSEDSRRAFLEIKAAIQDLRRSR